MNPVVHFELPYHQAERAVKFYQVVFGWKTSLLGSEMGGYILLTTAEKDVKPGMPAGAINGGMFLFNEDRPAQYPSIVIGVENIQKTIATINENGGEVLGEPHYIPETGKYVAFMNTEGSRLSILEPDM